LHDVLFELVARVVSANGDLHGRPPLATIVTQLVALV
jgi:hypothetical protein